MFNPRSAIDNPFAYSYIEGDKGMFNAWWMYETIEFPSIANRLERGDSLLVEGKRYYVAGHNEENDFILVDDTVTPTYRRVLHNNSQTVVVCEPRCEIYRHGARLGYQGPEEIA